MSDYVIAPRHLTADMATAMKSALFLDTAWTAALLASPSPVSMEEIVEVLDRLVKCGGWQVKGGVYYNDDLPDALEGACSLLSRLSSTEEKP